MTEWAKKELGALCKRINTVSETTSEVYKYVQEDPARLDEDPEHYLRLFTGLFEIANSAVEDCMHLKVRAEDEDDRDAFEELLEQTLPIAMMLSNVTKKLKEEMGS